jgi:hypothetical protein
MTGILSMLIGQIYGGSTPVITDPYFDYTTLLLPGNGTNGAQNNTFLDGSTNNFTITRNGNTTQGTFSPFSQTGWGNYFDGTGDYLSVAGSANLDSTGDFTLEAWAYVISASSYGGIVSMRSGSSGTPGASINIVNTGFLEFSNTGGGYGGTAVPLNQWFHVALVRSGSATNNCSCYLNGNRVGQFTSTGQANGASNVMVIGRYYADGTNQYWINGYISNVRYVVGTALYSGTSISVPTSNLTAVSGTQLLACQANRFIDNSSNNFTITRNGDTRVVAFSPFNPSASWSAATNGGSGYFDGSGDYLRLNAGITELLLSNSDWSFDCWVYWTSSASRSILFCGQTDAATASGSSYFFPVTNASGVADIWVGTTNYSITAPAPALNTWAHIAYARTGGTVSSYLNGTRIGTRSDFGTSSINNGATTYGATVGASGTGSLFTGYMSSLRLIKGSGGYDATSSTITVPTAPLTAITNTSLLLNFTNAGIYDATSKNDLETVGNAQISTAQSKWGGSSMAFDGTGDYLQTNVATTDLYAFGTGNFTVECWVYFNSLSGTPVLIDFRAASGGAYIFIYANGSSSINFYTNSAIQITGTISLSTSVWYHVALSRSGTNTKLFVNGNQVGSTYVDSSNYLNAARRPMIGANGVNLLDNLNGYIQDLRITKGYARYTANFTPPTAAFPTL